MAKGPGKYDDLATQVREAAEAPAVVVIVIKGNRGSGFSVQASADLTASLPALLRHIADEIDRSV